MLNKQITEVEDSDNVFKIGVDGVISITEGPAPDRTWYYDVEYDDGVVWRVLCPSQVKFSPVEDPSLPPNQGEWR